MPKLQFGQQVQMMTRLLGTQQLAVSLQSSGINSDSLSIEATQKSAPSVLLDPTVDGRAKVRLEQIYYKGLVNQS